MPIIRLGSRIVFPISSPETKRETQIEVLGGTCRSPSSFTPRVPPCAIDTGANNLGAITTGLVCAKSRFQKRRLRLFTPEGGSQTVFRRFPTSRMRTAPQVACASGSCHRPLLRSIFGGGVKGSRGTVCACEGRSPLVATVAMTGSRAGKSGSRTRHVFPSTSL